MQNKLHVQFNRGSYEKCSCLETDVSPCSIESGCINVFSNIECSPEFCPAKGYCLNQNFRRGQQFSFQIQKTDSKGWGLFAMEEIPARRFIIEYTGEVLDNIEFEHRFKAIQGKNFYFCALGQNMYIDSKSYGNESRYINHSCDPNAAAEKWIVYSNGREHTRVGLFAIRKINQVGSIYLTKNCLPKIFFF